MKLAAKVRQLLRRHGGNEAALAEALLVALQGVPPPLGPRQRQVAELLLEGCENPEIAQRLGLSCSAVKTYMSKLFRRYGFQNRSGQHGQRLRLALLLLRRQEKGEPW